MSDLLTMAADYADHILYQTFTHPVNTPPVGRVWQPIMLSDRILVAEQSIFRQPIRSRDLYKSTLTLTGIDEGSERPDPITRQARALT